MVPEDCERPELTECGRGCVWDFRQGEHPCVLTEERKQMVMGQLESYIPAGWTQGVIDDYFPKVSEENITEELDTPLGDVLDSSPDQEPEPPDRGCET